MVNPDTVTEGQIVTLTCSTTCTLTGSPAFIWYWNGSPLSLTNQRVYFTASIEDAGKYSCAVKGYEDLRTPAVALNVRYPPKRISVSVSSSGEILEGSSVTLTCSSDANPPVQNYTWFKNNRGVFSETGGPEESYTIKKITQQDAGEYYCKAGNGIGTNSSPPKRLDVQYSPKNTSVSVSSSAEVEEGSSVTLTCSSDANPPVQRYTWFKDNSLKNSGRSYTIKEIRSSDAGEYFCEANNEIGTDRSPHIHLKVLCLKVEMNSDSVREGEMVTLTCNNTCTHPSYGTTFIWYRNGQLQSSTFNRNFKARNEDAGSYSCGVGYNNHLSSSAVLLSVKYPPKRISVSVSSSGEILEGSSVTLTCISDANPPVQNYTWFKNNRAVFSETGGPEESYTIKNITQQDAGEYYCKAGNGIGTNSSPPKRLDVQ
ncbi:hypothetical protein SKAU_G00417900 [Synaphobranchus kaupii]|uniref:Ig-like domain-containing protein n=1 Tax=Synaphobranchus kaupii TaxID=118154 RepID=A0A9Q1IAV5_SYNKA|nr:hypothetical protein SKAU_G00417900 [Synaphobranchus kaupii]